MEISVSDENDTPPVFEDTFELILSESFLPGHRLGKIKANDADLDSVINYSISLASQTYMEIQSTTGKNEIRKGQLVRDFLDCCTKL